MRLCKRSTAFAGTNALVRDRHLTRVLKLKTNRSSNLDAFCRRSDDHGRFAHASYSSVHLTNAKHQLRRDAPSAACCC